LQVDVISDGKISFESRFFSMDGRLIGEKGMMMGHRYFNLRACINKKGCPIELRQPPSMGEHGTVRNALKTIICKIQFYPKITRSDVDIKSNQQ